MPPEALLKFPGQIDLSFYVDFQNLAKAAEASHMWAQTRVLRQGHFLDQMGIRIRAQQVKESLRAKGYVEHNQKSVDELIDVQVQRLTEPGFMGMVYKFLLIAKQLTFPFDVEK